MRSNVATYVSRAVLTGIVAIMVFSCGPVSARERDDAPRLVVLETPDASGMIDVQKLTDCLELTAAEFHLSERDLPLIVVFHISQAAAKKLGIAVSSTFRNTGPTTRYEMWIIGEPSESVYSYMAENIFEHHFRLTVSENERARILKTVQSKLEMTVSVRDLQRKSN